MEPEERFARIEALLHARAERQNQMESRFNHRMERCKRRMETDKAKPKRRSGASRQWRRKRG